MAQRELRSFAPFFRLCPTPLNSLRLRLVTSHYQPSSGESNHIITTRRNTKSIPPFRPTRLFSSSATSRAAASSSSGAIVDKSRILEKPARFNPPSHGARRVRPRSYPGPRLSEEELERQKTKRYPNMMPPEDSYMYSFLTNRTLHLWITLSTLTFLAVFAWTQSFLHSTIYRDQLPSYSDLLSHPFSSIRRFFGVYKMHVAHESEIVAQKRRKKLEDVEKRKEFLREHGVEPGFLTGSWLDKFGTVESDEAKAKLERERGAAVETQPHESNAAHQEALHISSSQDAQTPVAQARGDEGSAPEKKKVKMWLGIW